MQQENITIHASSAYTVSLGHGLLKTLGQGVAQLGAAKAVLVADKTVYALYGRQAEDSLRSAGLAVLPYVFAGGEPQKSLQTVGDIVGFLAQNEISRTDCIVALGGGVTGDIAGFCAAVYARGLPYVQVPTTLLAMVDASVGGKTGVNLPQGKNLVGAFHQPSWVLCDVALLATLPQEERKNGLAECVKYAAICDAALFAELEADAFATDSQKVVSACIHHKKRFVEADEHDTNQRRLLNFGHTIAHAVELASGYRIPHGQAVAYGMRTISQIAQQMGLCAPQVPARLAALLAEQGLNTPIAYSAQTLMQGIAADKKRTGEEIDLVLLPKIGEAFLQRMPLQQLSDMLRELLEA